MVMEHLINGVLRLVGASGQGFKGGFLDVFRVTVCNNYADWSAQITVGEI